MLFLGRFGAWWTNRGRNIFHYRDGTKTVRADPSVLGARLERCCPDYVDLLQLLSTKLDDAPPGPVRIDLLTQQKKAKDAIAKAAYDTFDLKPLDQTGGVTQAEAVAVLTSYFLFMEELAEEARLFQTSPEAA